MKSKTSSTPIFLVAKATDYAQLTKMRLASLVVFSALSGYIFATGWSGIVGIEMIYLILGGFAVTGASNAFNQIIERDLDRLMNRTADRPIPGGRMEASEGILIASLLGIVGIAILWLGLNPLSGILGMLALFLYVAVYTPLKRVGPIAVFAGAFPGAIPPMLGYVAATNEFGLIPGVLFATQFIWQFPHFWAIAWKAHADYSKAGFRLLPSSTGKSYISAFYILVYSIFLIPLSLFPIYLTDGSIIATISVLISGVVFAGYAFKLYRKKDDEAALQLMFASFVYLPVVQIMYLI